MSYTVVRLHFVVFVIAGLVVVAFARLGMWRTRPRSRLFTIGMLLLAASYMVGLPAVGDRLIDPALSSLLGENRSDVLATLLSIAGGFVFGLIFLRVWTPHRFQGLWVGYALVSAAGIVMASRVGDLAVRPVDDALELHDGPTVVYILIRFAFGASACVLIISGSVRAIRMSRGRLRGASLVLIGLGVAGLTYTALVVFLLLVDPDGLADSQGTIAVWGAGATMSLVSVAGLYGLVDAGGRRRRTPWQAA